MSNGQIHPNLSRLHSMEHQQDIIDRQQQMIQKLTDALGVMVEAADFSEMTNEELRHEVMLGNQYAPILLQGRAALHEARTLFRPQQIDVVELFGSGADKGAILSTLIAYARFLEGWVLWGAEGAKFNVEYNPHLGIRSNAYHYSHAVGELAHRRLGELTYPFGKERHDRQMTSGTLHTCPLRLKWVSNEIKLVREFINDFNS